MRSSQLSSNLKQKLSALSQSVPSSSSTPILTSPRQKFNDLLPSAWRQRTGRRHLQPQTTLDDGSPFSLLRMDEVVSELIFQAGVDFETRPMVVMAACAFPDPATISYDILLSRILSYLDLYVESDYTLVFLAAGNHHAPSWNWVWKAYRSLSRKYRKNLKKLYIVHPSFFSKMIFSLAGTLISPKFFQKIQYCRTLSDLARHVPLTQIDIPPEVYKENLKFEEKIELPVPPLSSHFGVSLEELMGAYGEKGGIPRVVRDCVTYLREYGLEHTGLFRRSPSSAILKQVKDAYDRGQTVSLETYRDLNLAAVLLKMFFRDLPRPIFPESMYPIIRQCPSTSEEDGDVACITYIRENILPAMESFSAVLVLSYVLNLLHDISLRADTNKMTSYNLAIVFSPNLVKSPNPLKDAEMCAVPGAPSMSADMKGPDGVGDPTSKKATETNAASAGTVGMVVKCCIERYFEIFDEVPDRSEAIPVPESLLQSMTAMSASGLTRNTGFSNNDAAVGSVATAPPASSHLSRHPASGADFAKKRTSVNDNSNSSSRGGRDNGGGSPSIMNGTSNPYATVRRARSVISIEQNTGSMTARGTRRGTIRLGSGKGAIKSPAAGVEALGVTAAGFFSSSN